MADTPTEGGSSKAPAPRRARKPRAASAAKSTGGNAKTTAGPAPAKAAANAKPAAAKRTTRAATPKAAAKSNGRARKANGAKPAAAPAKAPSPAARLAKSVQQGAAAVAPTGRKKFAIVAALAGIAAGIATVFGRRKINKAATEAIDAVSGTDSSAPAATAESSTTD